MVRPAPALNTKQYHGRRLTPRIRLIACRSFFNVSSLAFFSHLRSVADNPEWMPDMIDQDHLHLCSEDGHTLFGEPPMHHWHMVFVGVPGSVDRAQAEAASGASPFYPSD